MRGCGWGAGAGLEDVELPLEDGVGRAGRGEDGGVVLFCWFCSFAGEGEAHGWVAGWKGRERDGGG